jgi:hypothetical protein
MRVSSTWESCPWRRRNSPPRQLAGAPRGQFREGAEDFVDFVSGRAADRDLRCAGGEPRDHPHRADLLRLHENASFDRFLLGFVGLSGAPLGVDFFLDAI